MAAENNNGQCIKNLNLSFALFCLLFSIYDHQ